MAIFKRAGNHRFEGLAGALSGGRPDVLAHGEGEGLLLVGTREALALRRGERWQVWGWHEVAGGSWNGETSTFRWKTMAGEQHEARLSEVNRLPELFLERVQASTVVQTVVDARPRGEVQIIGRRGLGAESTIHWYAIGSGGADLADPDTRALVVAETDRLRDDYL